MTKNEKQTFRPFERRAFLKLAGIVGVGAIAGVTIQSVFDVVRIGRRLLKVSQTRIAMGTYVTITVIHESRGQAEEAIGRAFEEMDQHIAILSRHEPASALSVLNAEGSLDSVPFQLDDVLQMALHYHGATHGVFDVTVKPLIDLMSETVGRAAAPPRADRIDAAIDLVGMDGVEHSPLKGSVRFKRPGMGVTLDGIAKGYIVDLASASLSNHGIHNHLINAGGDIRTRGARADGKPWKVAIEDPKKRRNYPDVIRMTDGAVATSGNYEIYFDKEKVFHHIVDPRDGQSPNHNAGVSVIAKSVSEADALSTAVYVHDPIDGVRLIDSMGGAECLVLGENGEQYRSRNWNTAVKGAA